MNKFATDTGRQVAWLMKAAQDIPGPLTLSGNVGMSNRRRPAFNAGFRPDELRGAVPKPRAYADDAMLATKSREQADNVRRGIFRSGQSELKAKLYPKLDEMPLHTGPGEVVGLTRQRDPRDLLQFLLPSLEESHRGNSLTDVLIPGSRLHPAELSGGAGIVGGRGPNYFRDFHGGLTSFQRADPSLPGEGPSNFRTPLARGMMGGISSPGSGRPAFSTSDIRAGNIFTSPPQMKSVPGATYVNPLVVQDPGHKQAQDLYPPTPEKPVSLPKLVSDVRASGIRPFQGIRNFLGDIGNYGRDLSEYINEAKEPLDPGVASDVVADLRLPRSGFKVPSPSPTPESITSHPGFIANQLWQKQEGKNLGTSPR